MLFIYFLYCIFLIILLLKTNQKQSFIKINFLHDKLYEMLEKCLPIFEKYKICYFVDGGSLLGAFREQKIISFDDDIDIGMMQYDEQKLFSFEFQKDLKKVNLRFDSTGFVYKIYDENDFFIDIFIYEDKNDKIALANEKQKNLWPSSYYKYNELFPLKTYKFNTIFVLGANSPIPYFTRQYGKNWNIPISTHKHHNTE